jgi:acetyl-CoA synthetase
MMPQPVLAHDIQTLAESDELATLSGVQSIAQMCEQFNAAVDAQAGTLVQRAAPAVWAVARDEVIAPNTPLAVKTALYNAAFEGWDEQQQGQRPTWEASDKQKANSNVGLLMNDKSFRTVDELYQWSIDNGQEFWRIMLDKLGVSDQFTTPYTELVDTTNPEEPKWFPGAEINLADVLMRHDDDKIAVKYQQDGGKLKLVTFGELNKISNQVANGLSAAGINAGDSIAINMSFNIESVATYIGAIKVGCTMVCVPNTFKGDELDVRFDQIKGGIKLVVTQDTTRDLKGFPIYDNLVNAERAPKAVVVFGEGRDEVLKRAGDVSWSTFIDGQSDEFSSVPRPADHNVVVHFSSGTSSAEGKAKPPKAIPWKAHMAIKSAADGYLNQNLTADKTAFWTTNPGWMMGSWAVVASLMNGAALAIYDGNYNSVEQGTFLEEAKVDMVGVVPSVVKGWIKSGCLEHADLSSVELFSSTGEPSNKNDYFYLMSLKAGFVPVIEYMGGTEVGGGNITNDLLRIFSPATFSTPAFGTRLAIAGRDFTHAEYEENEMAIVMQHGGTRTPAMGLSSELLNKDHHETYFAREGAELDGFKLREHGDILLFGASGLIVSDGRAGESFNINGIKTSSSDMEKMIKNGNVHAIDDVAVVGARPPAGGEDVIFAYVKLSGDELLGDDAVVKLLKGAIKQEAPQLSKIDRIIQVPEVSRTNSGKIEHAMLKKQAGEILQSEIKVAS